MAVPPRADLGTLPHRRPRAERGRGGGGGLKLIWWQGAVHLNPHFAGGTKEQDATRIFYEPLAGWDSEGNLIPCLAAEIPTRANGGLSADGKSVTWKLKKGASWHDGKPFTADDVLFSFGRIRQPQGTMGIYVTGIAEIKKIKSAS